MLLQKTVLVALIVLALAGLVPAPLALAAGIVVGVVLGNPWPAESSRTAKRLLQLSVIGLGFGIGLDEVWEVGRVGIVYTVLGISATLLLGTLLGRALGVRRNTVTLITFGTAICGGSAIAAMAPVIEADDEEITVSIAAVFALNAVALFVFPALGRLFELSQHEFGYWAALAIHDTSSVVAAGSVYGATALAIATTVKLARAVWIAPITLIAGAIRRTSGRASFPWFILGFLAAAALRTLLPENQELWAMLVVLAKRALIVTLLLIGAGMTRKVISRVGPRPLVFAVVLWVIVSTGALVAVRAGHFAS